MARKAKSESAKEGSKNCAVLAVQSPVLAAQALQTFSGFHDRVDLADLITELKNVGNDVVTGDMGRIEKMLATQSVLLDAIFGNLMCRAEKCETLKPMELYMRLGLKAQAQARATAESLAMVKNPQPYIRQANIAAGHQQVNNTYAPPIDAARAGGTQLEPTQLLEEIDGERLDTRAAEKTVGNDPEMETVGAIDRSQN